jgi:hypothetical protein
MHNLKKYSGLAKTKKMHNSFAIKQTKKLFQFILGITFLFLCTTVSAQKTDTLKKDSTKMQAGKYHSPKKAALLSAVLPGSGQIYNKKYWKVPIVYAGFAGLAYSFQYNQSRYVKYRDALKFRIDNDSTTTDNYVGIYSDDQLTTLYKYYHRYRDLTVIGGLTLYLLNIIDAAVDAHLFTFNVSDDLTLHIQPTLINTTSIKHYSTAIGLRITF